MTVQMIVVNAQQQARMVNLLKGDQLTIAKGDWYPTITTVGTAGEYVVTWEGNSGVGYGIFVQKFNADGTTSGNQVKLEGVINGINVLPQTTAVGSAGEYVVTWQSTS